MKKRIKKKMKIKKELFFVIMIFTDIYFPEKLII